MKNILCFGNSNTFGNNPAGGRWDRTIRWPGRLQMLLGEEYHIIEEGCGGRTTVWDDPLDPHKCGLEALPICLASHKPLDLVIIALGENDLKERFHALPVDIAGGIKELALQVKSFRYGPAYPVPEILIVSPIILGEDIENSIFTGFTSTARNRSKELAPLYKKVADELECGYFDASTVACASGIDSLHMEADSHIRIAEALLNIVRELCE